MNMWRNENDMIFNAVESVATLSSGSDVLEKIEILDKELLSHFEGKFSVESALNRTLVSFQANKTRPVYRWYKYKEAFSATLVEYLFHRYGINQGRMLDPFAGCGTALFAASATGLDADGIELLPIGQQIIKTKQVLESDFTAQDFAILKRWALESFWKNSLAQFLLPELRITKGAYPENTRKLLELYFSYAETENPRIKTVLQFASLCVLEEVSYTRKDGQYLRWDYRSGRKQGKKPFDKGEILDFEKAVRAKLNDIIIDCSTYHQGRNDLFPMQCQQGKIKLYSGSCLELLPTLPSHAYDVIITSPPYCNRYDYTRTYALELALLGVDEKNLSRLRQEMLSCTVENRSKDLIIKNSAWRKALSVADEQKNLQGILTYLNNLKIDGELNNNGIPRMIKGYFYEMACVITECARVLKSGALMFMVNDNVRYAGASVSVDMILSEFAEKLGFFVEQILVLPSGKGNSSQQMGEHGREALRKCVYIWRRNTMMDVA